MYLAQGDFDRAEEALQRAVLRALDSGLENWFRVALRDLAQVACHSSNAVLAAKLEGASRRNMPAWGLDRGVYGAIADSCIAELGPQAFRELSMERNQLGVEQRLALAIRN